MTFFRSVLATMAALIFAYLVIEGARGEAPTPRVAVIVSTGDHGRLAESFKILEKQATETYEKLGFKVVLVGGVDRSGIPLTHNALQQTLSELSGVKDLRLDFIGHGEFEKIKSASNSKGIKLSAERQQNSSRPEAFTSAENQNWVAGNFQSADVSFFREIATRFGLLKKTGVAISQDQVSAALANFRKANPEGFATVNLGNCYSGIIAQELRMDPNTIVYASSPHNTTTVSFDVLQNENRPGAQSDWRNGLAKYYDQLEKSARSQPQAQTFDSIRRAANKQFADLLRDDPLNVYGVGRSPMFESAIAWCEAGRPFATSTPLKFTARSEENQRLAIAQQLTSDVTEIRRRFKVASTSMSAAMKEEFEACRAGGARDKEKSDKSKEDEYAHLISLYRSDPKGPISGLVSGYENMLNNISFHPNFVSQVKAGIVDDLKSLKELNLPEKRWTEVKQLISSAKNGKLSDEAIIERLRQMVSELKKKCVEGDPFTAPCYPDFIDISRDLARFLLSPEYIEKAKSVEMYWRARDNLQNLKAQKRTRSLRGFDCSRLDWANYTRSEKNIELDEKCIENFAKSAPESEWRNLIRLNALGQRNARGESNEPIPASPDLNSSKKTRR